MTDLTEQWKKGELPDGEDYYIKWKDSEVFTATFVDFMGRKMFQRMELEFEELPIEHYLSVLAPVPSYEEWKEKTKSLKVLAEAYCKEKQQNKQLKELLARAKGIITAYRLTGNQSTYSDNDMKECVAKIDEALR